MVNSMSGSALYSVKKKRKAFPTNMCTYWSMSVTSRENVRRAGRLVKGIPSLWWPDAKEKRAFAPVIVAQKREILAGVRGY